MRIDRLEIHGFGKYQNFTLDLGDGFHVIYGKNEAGKTTLQAFILAMLFGMKKPAKKRTVYSEDYNRYLPWEAKGYGGVLVCTINGQSYRIERSFLKNKEDCRIYLADTGEEITHKFPEDARKERLFVQTLVGIDELMFKHSLCLGDGMRSDWEEWRRETAPKLISGSHLQTADQALIQKAESVIAQRIEEIGTERAESKLLGQAVAKKQQLRFAIEKEEANEAAAKELCEELDRMQTMCREKQEQLSKRKAELAGQIQSLLQRLESEKSETEMSAALYLEDRSVPMGFSPERFQELRVALHKKSESCRNLIQERAAFYARMASLQPDEESVGFAARYEHLTDEDIQRIEELDRQLTGEIRGEFSDNGWKEGKIPGWNPLLLLIGTVALVAAGVSILIGNWSIGAMAAIVAVVSLAASLARYNKRRQYIRIAEREQEKQKAMIEKWEAELVVLLQRFDADTPRQARLRWRQILQTRERLRAVGEQLEWTSGEVRKVETRLQQELAEIEQALRESGIFPAEFRLNRDNDPEELEQVVKEWESKAAEMLLQLERLQRSLEIQQEIARWQKRLQQLGVSPETVSLPDSPWSAGQLDEELADLEQEERLYMGEYAKLKELQGRLQSLRQGRARMVQWGRELDYWREQEAKWLRMREALETTREVFEEIRVALYREQAPRLVQKVTGLAEIFTGGRYSRLQVDGQLEVRVTSPDSGYTYEMTGLSKGTIDQLSFALSLAVAESVIEDGDELPLLIDEPFLHYDDQRLKNTLEYLLMSANRRQILFFTHRLMDVGLLQGLSEQKIAVHNL